MTLVLIKLNLHETDLLFQYLSHHLNNFTTETITKTILRANPANFLQICTNLKKYWNIAMSNDGSNIEIIDQSHGD